MILGSQQPMIYLGMRQFTSSKGNLLNVVTLADPEKYENFDFFVQLNDFNANGLMTNSPVVPAFELRKYNNNTDLRLVSCTPVMDKVAAK